MSTLAAPPLSFEGTVIDAATGRPIEGASVDVHRQSDSADDITPCSTDSAGVFRFALTPDEAGNPSLYLELDIRHPRYAPRTGEGYGLGLIRRDLAFNQPPWFRRVELSPASEVSGVILDPEGKPAAGVPIRFVSIAGPSEMRFMAVPPQRCDDRTTTDDAGRFRFNAIDSAAITEFIAEPNDFAPLYCNVRDLRGDLGTFRLHHGVRVQGVVLDAAGAPLAAVAVELESVQKTEVQHAVNFRRTLTGPDGRFTLNPVATGAYEINAGHRGGERSHAFVPQKVIVEFRDHDAPTEAEVRALPHAVIRARYVDGAGNPCKGHGAHLAGKFGDQRQVWRGPADDHGVIEVVVPAGVSEAKLLVGTDPYSVLRYRRGPSGQSRPAGYEIDLGTIDRDVDDLFIIRHQAPTLIVRAVSATSGQPIDDFRPQVTYSPGVVPPMRGKWITRVKGDVLLRRYDDGSWHTSQLLPDEELTVTVEAEGFTPVSQCLKLAEAEVREIVVTLTPLTP